MIDPRKFDEFKKFFAEYGVIVRGELDAEYKKVAGMIAEWDKRNNLAQQQQEIAKAKSELATQTNATNAAHAGRETKLKAWEEGLKKREQEVEAKFKEHAGLSDSLRAAQAAHDSTVAATKKAFEAQSATLEQKAKDLANLQMGLHLRELKVAERENKVQTVLGQMNTALKG